MHPEMRIFPLVFMALTATVVAAAESATLSRKIESMRIKTPPPVLDVLDSLGLEKAADFAMLAEHERHEMMAALEEGGVCLGDRAKLRHHFGKLTTDGSVSDEYHEAIEMAGAGALQPVSSIRYRLQQEAAAGLAAPVECSESGTSGAGLSADTVALVVTALLGIGSFVLQGKLSKDAETAHRTSEHVQDEREKARLAATIQLDRVRLQVFLSCTLRSNACPNILKSRVLSLNSPSLAADERLHRASSMEPYGPLHAPAATWERAGPPRTMLPYGQQRHAIRFAIGRAKHRDF
jgi:hypothetical protein